MQKDAAHLSLGEFLRHEREKRGVTIEQLVSATKISLRLLQALENDQYAVLPAKPFIRGFVVSYCRFLGISSQEVLTRYSLYLEDRVAERPKRDAGHSGYAFEKKETEGGRTGLWILMGSVVVFGAVAMLVFKPALKRHRKSHVEKLQQATELNASVPVVTATPVAVASPIAIPEPTPEPSPVPSPSASVAERRPDPMLSGKDLLKEEIRVKVVVKATEDVWVRYRVDEKAKNRLVLRAGVTLVLFAKDAAALQVSNPAGVQVTRSVGPPNRLALLHGNRPLLEILDQKPDVNPAGVTLFTVADSTESPADPFQGDPVMGAPPPKPGRSASPPAVQQPDLSTP